MKPCVKILIVAAGAVIVVAAVFHAGRAWEKQSVAQERLDGMAAPHREGLAGTRFDGTDAPHREGLAGTAAPRRERLAVTAAPHREQLAGTAASHREQLAGTAASHRERLGGTAAPHLARVLEICAMPSFAHNHNRVVELARLAEGRSVAELAEILESIEKDVPRGQRWNARNVFLDKLADADPQAALAHVGKMRQNDRQGAYQTVAISWARNDPEAALEWQASLPKSRMNDSIFDSIVMAVAEEDPEEALNIMDAQNTGSPGWNWRGSAIYEHWAQTEPKKAAERAGELADSRQRSRAQQGIAAAWAARDPLDALDWTDTIENTGERKAAVNTILNTWAENDPDAAVRYARGFPAGEARNEAVRTVAGQLVQTDPEAALALAGELPEGSNRSGQINNLLSQWAGYDPDAAVAHIGKMPDGNERSQALRQIAQHLAYADPEAAVAIANMLPVGQRGGIVSSIVSNLAQTDMKQALEWVGLLPDGSEKRSALDSISWQIRQSEPEITIAFIATLPPGDQRDRFITQNANSLARQDLDKAFAWVETLGDSAAKKNAFQNVFNEWVNQNPAAALKYAVANDADLVQNAARRYAEQDMRAAENWYKSLPEGKAKENALNGIANGLASYDPVNAARFVSSLPAGKEQEGAALNVARSWANNDPEAAANWAAGFPAEAQGKAMESIARSWADKDPATAGAWIAKLKDDGVRDTALETYVNTASNSYPEYAAAYATAITDAKKRENAVYNAASNWLRYDPAAALKWLGTTDLPDKRKQELIDRANRNR